jgi:hypothetical protein
MQRAKNSFAEGEIRIACHAQLSKAEKQLDDPKSAMVMKSHKHLGEGLNDQAQCFKQMECSTIAHFLARECNKSCSRPDHCAMVRTLQACVVEEEKEENKMSRKRRFCAK